MYQTSLYFNLKVTPEKIFILKMFFEDWADRICNNEVAYSTIVANRPLLGPESEIIKVDFVREEDAVAMKLRGIPQEFQKYLEIVN